MTVELPAWAEWLVAALLVTSGVFSLVAAIGMIRLRDFFQRMHPPALASTLGTWCLALATIVYLGVYQGHVELHPWLIIILMSITVPVTTNLLARAALLRERAEAAPGVPPALQPASEAPLDEAGEADDSGAADAAGRPAAGA